jgi:hypothetical protein
MMGSWIANGLPDETSRRNRECLAFASSSAGSRTPLDAPAPCDLGASAVASVNGTGNHVVVEDTVSGSCDCCGIGGGGGIGSDSALETLYDVGLASGSRTPLSCAGGVVGCGCIVTSSVGGAVDLDGGVAGTGCIATSSVFVADGGVVGFGCIASSSVGNVKRICFVSRGGGVVGVGGVAGGCNGAVLIGAPAGC